MESGLKSTTTIPMTTIATFPTPEDAHLFRAFLESRGLRAACCRRHAASLLAVQELRSRLRKPQRQQAARSPRFSAMAAPANLLGGV